MLQGGTLANNIAQLPCVRACLRPFISGLNTKIVYREMIEIAIRVFNKCDGNPPCCGGSLIIPTLNSRESESVLQILKDYHFQRACQTQIPNVAKEFHDYLASMTHASSDGGVDCTRDEFVISWMRVMRAAMEGMAGTLEKRILEELARQEAHRLAHSTAKSHDLMAP